MIARLPAALVLALACSLASAQEYPAREIRSICNFAAGSGADIIVRFYSDRLSKLAGKSVAFPGTPESMTALLKTESERWGRWVRMAKIEPQ